MTLPSRDRRRGPPHRHTPKPSRHPSNRLRRRKRRQRHRIHGRTLLLLLLLHHAKPNSNPPTQPPRSDVHTLHLRILLPPPQSRSPDLRRTLQPPRMAAQDLPHPPAAKPRYRTGGDRAPSRGGRDGGGSFVGGR